MTPNRFCVLPLRILPLVALLVACTSVRTGTQVSADVVGEIERGVTTQADVQRSFGDPTSIQIRSDRTSVWRYSYEEVRAQDTGTLTRLLCTVGVLVRIPACLFNAVSYRNAKTTRDELTVRFDEDRLVTSYTYLHEEIPASGVYDPVVTGPGTPGRPGRSPSRTRGPITIPVAVQSQDGA